jgi:DNA-binding LacI/PurR family transcriptional regulator
MAYTIKEIASRAGVSKSTVSRVISNTGYTSQAAREKVLQVIEELQYKPNAVARAMVSQRTNNIGVISTVNITLSPHIPFTVKYLTQF